MTPFPVRLKEIRKKNKKTQIECATLVGVSLRSYQYYESGEYEPTIVGLIKLADYFHVTVDYLIGRTDF